MSRINREKAIESVSTAFVAASHEAWVGECGGCTQMATLAVDTILKDAYGDDDVEFRVGRNAPDTSRAVSDKIKASSLGAQIMKRFVFYGTANPLLWTDEDIENVFNRKHQSASAARNTLVRKGYLVDSGERALTSSGNLAILWRWTGKPVVWA